jgi:tripartite-type tricarboxylate transporter receptor subunit TctC
MMAVHMIGRQGKRATFTMVACLLTSFPGLDAALAQSWPTRTVTAIAPFAAGSAADVMARIALEQISKQVGRPIIVENRLGAGGTLGANTVAKAQPNGDTLLAHSSSLAAAHGLYPTLPYDTLRDLTPVIPLGLQPMVLVTAPSKGWKTLGDLVAAARAKSGAFNFASAGVGSASHLAVERLRISAGFEAQHIPFKGAMEAFTEVMTGRVDTAFFPLAPALPLIKGGKLVALAVSTSKRTAALAQVPTTAEAGLSDSGYDFWVGLFLPAKTPHDIVVRLHQETERALNVTAVRERLAKLGVEPMPMNIDQFDAYFKNDVAAHVKIVKAAGLSPPR